jgi:hypothetical protein
MRLGSSEVALRIAMPNDRSRFLASLTEEQLRALHAELEALDRA